MNTLLFSVVLAAIDPGVMSVFTKREFDGVVDAVLLNFVVAFILATGEIANILSFAWTPLNQGRRKVPFLNGLQIAVIGCTVAIAFVPQSTTGLLLLSLIMLTARVCWSGIITIRPTIWRANYERSTRARIVGRLGRIEVIVLATSSCILGLLLDHARERLWIVTVIAGVAGLFAVTTLSKLRVRREKRILKDEATRPVLKPWLAPLAVVQVLRQDKFYAQFMLCMFVLGFGNLMIGPITVFLCKDQFDLPYWPSIFVTVVIPRILQALSIPLWAAFLDRAHVVRFRSIHSWAFVVAGAVFVLGAAFHSLWLLGLGTALMGFGFGGGALAWNLGHTDFAPTSETSRYMATHVTLNGVRGILAPICAWALYQFFHETNAGLVVYSIALAISIVGAIGFVRLRVRMGSLAATTVRGN